MFSPSAVPRPDFVFSYLYGKSSRSRLWITRAILTRILTFYQAMPTWLDFMLVFGVQDTARELRFGGFRKFECLDTPSDPSDCEQDEKHFELCYNLKGVTLKNTDETCLENKDWVIRPASIYLQFEVVTGAAVWMVTKGGLDLKERFIALSDTDSPQISFKDANHCLRSSLTTHIMFCQWAIEDWHGYIRWLEEIVEKQVCLTFRFRGLPNLSAEFYGHLELALAGC
jgi:hypothetical protein